MSTASIHKFVYYIWNAYFKDMNMMRAQNLTIG